MIPTRHALKEIFDNEEAALNFLTEQNIVLPITACPFDGSSITRLSLTRFRCRKKSHRGKYSMLSGTILEECRIKLGDFAYIMYSYICCIPIKSILLMTGHSKKTVHRIIKIFRQRICSEVEECYNKIGGENVVVQLDESKFGKRKYNRGHRVEGVWVFGGVEVTEQRRLFAVVVNARDNQTLNELILQHVLPGSIVVTDGWKGYSQFKQNELFSHQSVNHSMEYVNVAGFHTNHIEGTWNGIKMRIPPQSRTKRRIHGRLFEFIWRRTHESRLWSAFLRALGC